MSNKFKEKGKKFPLKILRDDEPRTPEMIRWGVIENGKNKEYRIAIKDMPLFLKLAKRYGSQTLFEEALRKFEARETRRKAQ